MSKIASSINPTAIADVPSTAGLTTKVLKGSFWTLTGQVIPLLATLISTPLIIRLLGSEAYGVLILVGLIPAYFSFADFGMNIASTKFGSEAYSQGLPEREGKVIRTALVIAFLSSITISIPIFLFSGYITGSLMNVPEHLQFQANVALKITAVSFNLGIIGGVLNTPQFSRLRMDLSTFINAGSKLLLAILTPLVLILGGRIIAAALASLFIAVLMMTSNLFVSGKLLPQIYRTTIDKSFFSPLLKFGGGILVSGIAGILLINLEKLFLTRMVSVQSLAYYSVAFTFANMATMFSVSMVQALIPAFSQLLTPEKRDEFNALFSRGFRINILGLLPAVMFLFVVAKPFFTLWAGPEFGRESSNPFYILLLGLLFSILAFVPHSSITAFGRTDVMAKVYWIELVPYILSVIVFIHYFGILGAAMAWTLRVVVDAFVFIYLSKRIIGISFEFVKDFWKFLIGSIILSPPILYAAFYNNFSFLLIPLVFLSGIFYVGFALRFLVYSDERSWLENKVSKILRLKQI